MSAFLDNTRNKIKGFFQLLWTHKKIILIWIGIVLTVLVALHYQLDKGIIGIGLLITLFSKAFADLLLLIGLLPWIGPIIVKVLSLPVFWILNGVGYLVSAMAIKRGHGKVVLNHRVVTVVFLVGVVVGYIIGRLL